MIKIDTQKYSELVAGSPRGEVLKAIIETNMESLYYEFKKIGLYTRIPDPQNTIYRMLIDLIWSINIDHLNENQLKSKWHKKFFLPPAIATNSIFLIDHWIESQILATRKKVAQAREQGVVGVGDPSDDL